MKSLQLQIYSQICPSINDVYKERNVKANSLSKEGSLLAHRKWHILEFKDGQSYEHLHRSFIKQI